MITPRRQTMREIVASVAERRRLRVSDLLGPSRERRISRARQESMALLREADRSWAEIGRALNRDPRTIRYGERAHRARLAAREGVGA